MYIRNIDEKSQGTGFVGAGGASTWGYLCWGYLWTIILGARRMAAITRTAQTVASIRNPSSMTAS